MVVKFNPGDTCVLARNRSGFPVNFVGRTLTVVRPYTEGGADHAVVRFVGDGEQYCGGEVGCYWDDLELAEGPW